MKILHKINISHSKENKDISIYEAASFIFSKEFRPMLMYGIYHGCEVAYYFTSLPTLSGESVLRESGKTKWDNEDQEIEADKKTCTTMIGFGVGEILGSFVIGHIGSRLGRKKTLHITFAFSLLALIIAMIITGVFRDDFNYWWFTAAVFWGGMDGCIAVSGHSIAISETSDPIKGSAAYDSIQTMSTTIFILVAAGMSEIHPFWLLLLFMCFLIVGYVIAYKYFIFKSVNAPAIPPVENTPDEQPEGDQQNQFFNNLFKVWF